MTANKLVIFLILLFLNVISGYSQIMDEYGSSFNNGILSGLAANDGGYASVGHNFVLNQGLQGTIEAWVYMTQYNPSLAAIYEKGSTFRFGVTNTSNQNKPFLLINTVSFLPIVSATVPLDRWVHLAATWLQAGSSTTVTFYMDGSQAGPPVTANVIPVSNSDSVTIGGSRLISGFGVIGNVDEVRYWNRQRPIDQITRTRFAGVGDFPAANQNSALVSSQEYFGLVSSWTFNKDSSVVPDNISNQHAFLRRGAVTVPTNITGQPVPYNLAAYFPGGVTDYMNVPDNIIFDRTVSGTLDGWINPDSSSTYETIISKGLSIPDMTFWVYIFNSRLYLSIGSTSIPGPIVPLKEWSHFAVTWSYSGTTCTVKFYLNGETTAPFVNTMPIPNTNSRPVWIGNAEFISSPYKGYIDELRLWNRDLSENEIKAYMFVSGRSSQQFLQNNLLASWNFDGNLNNITSVSDVNATFNIGSTNNCRFSAFTNDNTIGPITNLLKSHNTVLNRKDGSFSSGFIMRAPKKNLPFASFVYDTINVTGNSALTSIEVFLSVQQNIIGGSVISLIAPNGQERILLNNNGGQGSNVLTFFKDGSAPLTGFFAPWSYIAAPSQVMGTFNNTPIQGQWILKIVNGNSLHTGKLLGWGIRINNTVTSLQSVSEELPMVFKLHQNYPNPFNPSTKIRFDIPEDQNVKVTIYDLLGKEVSVPLNEMKHAGSYELTLDASGFASGIYFYKLEAGSFTDFKKMILVK